MQNNPSGISATSVDQIYVRRDYITSIYLLVLIVDTNKKEKN